MRVQPISVGSYMHCLKRGGRGMSIVDDDADRWRFLKSLYYLNDKFFDENWNRASFSQVIYNSQTVVNDLFFRPEEWPKREPLVKILCYILMPNHIHFLLKETQENGISTFMKKVGQSMTLSFNQKYGTKGSIFQGSYKGINVDDDVYIKYLAVYIMVKNAFELYPGGFVEATKNYDDAWNFAVNYPFSSLKDYVGKRDYPIISKDILSDLFDSVEELEDFSKDVIKGMDWRKDKDSQFYQVAIE